MKTIYTLVLLSLSYLFVSAQNQAELKYNLELNKVYRVKNITVQNTTQTVQGMQQSIQTNNTMVLSLKPLKKIESDMIAEVRFDTVITIINMPPMEINSSRPGDLKSADPSKILECIMNRLSNSTLLVKMSNTGHVIDIMNIDQVSAGILQGIDSIQGQMAEFVKERAKMMVEKGAIKSMIESVTAYLPGKEIKVNESWEDKLMVSAGGMDMTVTGTYKLTNIESNKAIVTGEMLVESGPKPMKMGGAEIIPDFRGIGKGDFTIDISSGWIINASNKQQLKGEMSVNAPGMSMQIPIEINSDTQIIAIP